MKVSGAGSTLKDVEKKTVAVLESGNTTVALESAESKAVRTIRNKKLAGRLHPVTDVPFDNDGFPIFNSRADIDLPGELIGPDVSDVAQFEFATRKLWDEIKDNEGLKNAFFSAEQLRQIENGEASIAGLTWHHHQNGVRLQLVDREKHLKTGHTGGRATTGGRPNE